MRQNSLVSLVCAALIFSHAATASAATKKSRFPAGPRVAKEQPSETTTIEASPEVEEAKSDPSAKAETDGANKEPVAQAAEPTTAPAPPTATPVAAPQVENRPKIENEPPKGPVMRAEPAKPETPSAAPTSHQAKTESKVNERLANDLKQNCQRHFPGLIQAEVRMACISAGADYERLGQLGRTLAQTRCRLSYGEEPRLVMACLIGTKIADELVNGSESFKKKLQLCGENYPVHNEIDAFLQESCLTGVHLPDLMKTDGRARFESCAQITPERSFIGPCAVGLSLAQEPASKVTPASQNKLCEKYFNLNRFHKGYRACLSAFSLAPELPAKTSEAIKSCGNVVSEANNDTERAACLVGLSIYRHLLQDDDIHKRYVKCGDNKVTYQDRDFLACLTAASLLDFTDKNGAEAGCREVFKELKSHSRGDCVNSLSLF